MPSPYTLEQVNLITRYLRASFQIRNAPPILNTDVGHVLGAMHRDGITVTFPKPRYEVVGGYEEWRVRDRDTGVNVAVFTLHPDAEVDAHAYAKRLNREAS